MLAKLPMTLELFELMEVITCFLDSSLVVMLILCLTGPVKIKESKLDLFYFSFYFSFYFYF